VATELQLRLDTKNGRLHDGRGRIFDPAVRRWKMTAVAPWGEAVSPARALLWLQRDSGAPLRAPVAVIGTRTPTTPQIEAAFSLGRLLGEHKITVLCGGGPA
jgi:hypothetical protein